MFVHFPASVSLKERDCLTAYVELGTPKRAASPHILGVFGGSSEVLPQKHAWLLNRGPEKKLSHSPAPLCVVGNVRLKDT